MKLIHGLKSLYTSESVLVDGHIEVMLEMVCRGLPEQYSDSQGNAGDMGLESAVVLVVSVAGDDSDSGNPCDIRVVIRNRQLSIQHGSLSPDHSQSIGSPSEHHTPRSVQGLSTPQELCQVSDFNFMGGYVLVE